MGKYRKKPVVIEAIQLKSNNVKQILEFMGVKTFENGEFNFITSEKWDDYCNALEKSVVKEGISIETLEGTMKASINDYIIKGINGEFYPCKPDIFQKTYEPIED